LPDFRDRKGVDGSWACRGPNATTAGRDVAEIRAASHYLGWIGGNLCAIWVTGFMLASGAFVFAFLVVVAEIRWTRALLATVPMLALLLFLAGTLDVQLPEGLISIALPERR